MITGPESSAFVCDVIPRRRLRFRRQLDRASDRDLPGVLRLLVGHRFVHDGLTGLTHVGPGGAGRVDPLSVRQRSGWLGPPAARDLEEDLGAAPVALGATLLLRVILRRGGGLLGTLAAVLEVAAV